uniref:Chemokine (C-X-C motif) ligand 14 n=1 Tax=Cyprinus carpio TaxID=7962 RepID=A0A8C2FAT2_CYPCA
MNRCTAALLLLVIAVYSLNTEGNGHQIYKPCKTSCQQKPVTMENVSRFKGQEYCLHPRLQSTKNLVKWFKIWKDKHRY